MFELIWDEAALTRFGMEARLVGEVLPHAEAMASELRAAIDGVTARAHALGVGVVDAASLAVWRQPSPS